MWIPCLKNQTYEIAKNFSTLIDNCTDHQYFKLINFSFNDGDNGFYTVDKLIEKYPVLKELQRGILNSFCDKIKFTLAKRICERLK